MIMETQRSRDVNGGKSPTVAARLCFLCMSIDVVCET